MNNDQLKDIIKNWLTEEEIPVSEKNFEGFDFTLRATWQGYIIDIAKPSKKNHIVSEAVIAFRAQEFQSAFPKLTIQERSDFMFSLQMGLAQFPIVFTIEPETIWDNNKILDLMKIKDLDKVTLNHYVFIDDITKTSLFNSMDTIRRSILVMGIITENKVINLQKWR